MGKRKHYPSDSSDMEASIGEMDEEELRAEEIADAEEAEIDEEEKDRKRDKKA